MKLAVKGDCRGRQCQQLLKKELYKLKNTFIQSLLIFCGKVPGEWVTKGTNLHAAPIDFPISLLKMEYVLTP